ncbi:MAG: NAD(P)/FAD-dependent oxidoreductase [Gammaproteobacteria bacterium]
MLDVLIIGAGPSGSVAAALLGKKGYSVRVLERQKFPRFSIGESLLAQSIALIDEAGMLEPVMSAGFQFKNGASFVRGTQHAEYNFADKSSEGPPFTFQVPRADFDKVLADTAARMGADIRYEIEITAADFSGTPTLTSREVNGGKVEQHQARFVLDASGFGRTLPRLLDLDRPAAFPMRAALFTHIRDHIPAGEFDRQKIRVTIHPQHQDVWYWLIPFSDGRSSLGVVARDEFLQAIPGDNEQRLWTLVRQDPSLGKLLRAAEPAAKVNELRGYAASVKSLHGKGFALLGNAAEFLDPVFSSGVTIALKSAHLAAGALHRQFSGEAVDWEEEFSKPLLAGVETFRGFVNTWYDGSLQDIFFYDKQQEKVRRMICSILAGYAWDKANHYHGKPTEQRLRALAEHCRAG